MICKHLVFTLLIIGLSNLLEINGQRSPYAGSRPSGYKDRFKPEVTGTGANGANTDVANRVGESTNERLPYDAYGDAALVNHYNQLPADKRPYWLINQAHIEAQRGTPGSGGGGTVLNSQRPQTAAQATANANTNTNANNANIANRFAENDATVGRPVGRIPNESENIYDHNLISQQPVVYPVNIPEEQRQQMEALVREQQRQAAAQRQTSNQNQNLNSNLNLIENQQQPQRSFPAPLVNPQRAERFLPLSDQGPPPFRPPPQNFYPVPSNSFGIAPYFVDYD